MLWMYAQSMVNAKRAAKYHDRMELMIKLVEKHGESTDRSKAKILEAVCSLNASTLKSSDSHNGVYQSPMAPSQRGEPAPA